jgi:hypothetical protein
MANTTAHARDEDLRMMASPDDCIRNIELFLIVSYRNLLTRIQPAVKAAAFRNCFRLNWEVTAPLLEVRGAKSDFPVPLHHPARSERSRNANALTD